VPWVLLAGAAALQLLAGVARVRGWFHVIKNSCPSAASLRYRDVVVAQLGGCGWNAVLPAHAGDAVKVALLRQRMPDTSLATVGSTLVPPALVEAVFTAVLVGALLAVGSLAPTDLAIHLPAAAPVVAAATCVVGVVAALVLRRRLHRLVDDLRTGLAVVRSPSLLITQVVPWQAAARGLRLLALATVLAAAGVPLGIGAALMLMALQGASPSVTPTAMALRVALLAGVLAGTGAGSATPAHIAAVLVASYAVTTVTNVAVSGIVIALTIRSFSPRRILRFARSAFGLAARETPAGPVPVPNVNSTAAGIGP